MSHAGFDKKQLLYIILFFGLALCIINVKKKPREPKTFLFIKMKPLGGARSMWLRSMRGGGSRRRRSSVHARMLSYTSRYWAHVPVTAHNSRLRPSTSPHTFTTSFVYLPTLQPHSEAGIYCPPRPVRPETWRGKFRPIALLLEKQKTFKSTRFVVIRFNNRFKLLKTI